MKSRALFLLGGNIVQSKKQKSVLLIFLEFVGMNVLGMIGLSCYILADTFFIAKGMGADGLTALNLAIPIYSFIHGTGLMLGIGGATRYAILQAQKQEAAAKNTFMQTVVWGGIFGTMFFAAGVLFAKPLSLFLGADEATASMTAIYLKTILAFAPAYIMNNIGIGFVRNDGSPKLAMGAMLMGSFSNIVLDYLFIFPLNMGMLGAALATGLAPIVSMVVLSGHFFRLKKRRVFVRCMPRLSFIKDSCGLGLAAFVNEISSGIVMIIFNMILLSLEGNIGVSAYGIIANLALVAAAVFTGIAQGIQPVVSANYGAGKQEQVFKILSFGIITSLAAAVCIYLAVWLGADPIIAIFNKDQNIILAELAAKGLGIYFIGFIFAGFNIVIATFFSAVASPKYAFILSMIRGGAAVIPLVYILSRFLGVVGIWSAFPLIEAFAVCLASFFLIEYRQKKKRTYKGYKSRVYNALECQNLKD